MDYTHAHAHGGIDIQEATRHIKVDLLAECRNILEDRVLMEYGCLGHSPQDLSSQLGQELSESGVMEMIWDCITAAEKEHTDGIRTLEHNQRLQVTQMKSNIESLTQQLTEFKQTLIQKEAEIKFLQENRVDMKDDFKNKTLEYMQQEQSYKTLINNLKHTNEELVENNQALSHHLHNIHAQLKEIPLEQYCCSLKHADLKLDQLGIPSQLEDTLHGHVRVIEAWERQKIHISDLLYEEYRGTSHLYNILIRGLRNKIEAKSVSLRRSNRKIQHLKKQLKKKRTPTAQKEEQESMEKECLLTECFVESRLSEVYFQEQICQTDENMASIDSRTQEHKVECQRANKSMEVMQSTVDSLNAFLSTERQRNTLLAHRAQEMENTIEEIREDNHKLQSRVQVLEEENKELVSQSQTINTQIQVAEESLNRVTLFSEEISKELVEERKQFKRLQQQIFSELEAEREDYTNSIHQFKQKTEILKSENKELQERCENFEEELGFLKKRLLMREEQSLSNKYSNRGSTDICQLNQTVKMGRDNKEYSRKIQSLNEIINYLVNYCKGYNFGGSVKVRRGCWIEGQSRGAILKILDKDNVNNKLNNYRAVKTLCESDARTQELIITFEGIMDFYFNE